MSDIIYILLAVLLVVILIILAKYNKLIKNKNKVSKTKANIEIYLNKRFDLIPNVVECVKGYSKHEKTTLEEIVKLRSDFDSQDKININEAGEMNNRLNNLLALVEDYPELKADTQYLSLQDELHNLEGELERARIAYNNAATEYNNAIEVVPSNIVASIFGFKKADLFTVEESKRDNVKVKL